MGELLVGTTLLVSFLGGVVALLAPCCVSVMLPAYLATGFRHRGGVLPATLVFGGGIATVILPIGLGAAALSRLFVNQHLVIYLIGGVLMGVGGVAVLSGQAPKLPMPAGRGTAGGGFGSAYLLGAFSGIASACCAPVLAGVAVLAGATASFPTALAIGLTYVAGMVAPLVVAGLLWDRRRDRAIRMLTARSVHLQLGGWSRRLPLGTLASGLLMIGMGALSVVVAFTGPGMDSGGWQTRFSAWLQHIVTLTAHALSWVPGWAVAVALTAGVVLLARRLLRARSAATWTDPGPAVLQLPMPSTADTATGKDTQ
jgi:cytochrome c biogenesis protein CcdA